MKKLLLGISILLFSATISNAQRQIEIEQGVDNSPSHVKHEIIVSFNPDVVNTAMVDDTTIQSGVLEDFVNTEAVIALEANLSPDAANFMVYKIFTRLTTEQTVSISRSGDSFPMPKFWATLIIVLPEEIVEEEAVLSLNNNIEIINNAELNFVGQLDATTNDTDYNLQTSLHPNTTFPNAHINVERAWDFTTGNTGIKVGVFDSGIDYRHEDFGNGTQQGSVIRGGYDYAYNQTLPNYIDVNGHGTAVAGIIGAIRNNTTGIAGIAGGDPSNGKVGVDLYSMQILNNQGNSVIWSDVANAIVEGASWTPNFGFGLQVMNHSWSKKSTDKNFNNHIYNASILQSAVLHAYNNQVIFVASRGNDGNDITRFPACFPDRMVMNVASSGTDGEHKNGTGNGDPYRSSFGHGVDIMAPGTTQIIRTTENTPNTYRTFNGTSAAAPHVAGVAALMLSYFNDYSVTPFKVLAPEDVANIIARTATDKSAPPSSVGYDDFSGWGLLNAGQALEALEKPNYNITHHSFTANASNTSLFLTDQKVILSQSRNGIPAGTYFADVYEVTYTTNVSIPAFHALLDFWPLNQTYRTNVWGLSGYLGSDINALKGNRNGNQISFNGYFYFIKNNILAQPINVWVPSNPAQTQGTIGYSAYWDTGQDIPGGGNGTQGSLLAYPNPTQNTTSLTYQLSQPSATTIQLRGMNGTILKSFSEPVKQSGVYTFNLDLSNLASGIYHYQIITSSQVFRGKVSKL